MEDRYIYVPNADIELYKDNMCKYLYINGKKIKYGKLEKKYLSDAIDSGNLFYNNGKWTEPVNLGYPVNTTGDDVFFSIAANGKYGYYSSRGKDSYGSFDIYEIAFLGKEKEVVTNNEDNLLAYRIEGVKEKVMEAKVAIAEVNLLILKGTITDEYSKKPLFATLELTDLSSNKVVATFENNKTTGKYLVSLPSGKNYGITVNSENIGISSTINIEQLNNGTEKEVGICTRIRH